MADIRLRPRFRQEAPCPPGQVLRVLGDAVRREDAPFEGTLFDTSAVLRVLPDDRHFWSPHLEVSVESTPNGSVVHGLFGPHPTVWSMFVGLYVAIGFVAAMGVAYGGAQWILGQAPWAFWAAPAGAVLAVLVWLAGRTGRRLGHAQVLMLYEFVQDRLRACEDLQPNQDVSR